MRAVRGAVAGLVAGFIGVAAAGAEAQYPAMTTVGSGDAIQVAANGDVLTQVLDSHSLSFTPASVTAQIGQTVRWTNTDFLVPHTVTEDHNLFDLGGTYGGTPANPSGFAPGASVERSFSAGTFRYHCRVHPVQMKAVVAVPVSLIRRGVLAFAARTGKSHRSGHRRQKHRRRRVPPPLPQSLITATWANAAPADGQVFDVRYRIANGDWRTLTSGTTMLSRTIPGGPAGTVWQVEARLRSAGDASKASDWSPPATITA